MNIKEAIKQELKAGNWEEFLPDLKELKDWRFELSYFDNAKPGEKCPTPKGVKKYILTLSVKIGSQVDIIMELKEEIHKLKITAERLKKGLKE